MLEIIRQPDICVGCENYDKPNFLQKLLGKRACKGPITVNYFSIAGSEGGDHTFGINGSKDYCREQETVDISTNWTQVGRKFIPTASVTKPTQLGVMTYEREVYPQNPVATQAHGVKTTSWDSQPPRFKASLNDKYAGRNVFLDSNMANPTAQEWPWNFQPTPAEKPKPKELVIALSAEPTLRQIKIDQLRAKRAGIEIPYDEDITRSSIFPDDRPLYQDEIEQ